MKKLLMGSIVLTVFSTSMLLFQMSCTKGANAQTTGGNLTQQNLIVYEKDVTTGAAGSGTTDVNEIWIANIDGTNKHKVPIVLPTGIRIISYPKLTPDGKIIVFPTSNTPTNGQYLTSIYSCSIDGSNLKQLITGSVTDNYNYERVFLDGAY